VCVCVHKHARSLCVLHERDVCSVELPRYYVWGVCVYARALIKMVIDHMSLTCPSLRFVYACRSCVYAYGGACLLGGGRGG
jgi:hypothetical protein